VAEHFDTIVLGLGAMGSASLYHLAKTGRRVLGMDRFEPPHAFGSSHGQTRIIREAYFEDPAYVPLVQRAYQLWEQLAAESGRVLFRQTGGLMVGPPGSTVLEGSKQSAQRHRLPHEILSASEVRRRFPALRPSEEMWALLEPRAGILFPEECIRAHLEIARQHGAEIMVNSEALRWETDGTIIHLPTAQGTFTTSRLIVCAGPWLSQLVPELAPVLEVERQVLYWFEPREHAGAFAADQLPVHLCEFAPGQYFYGFPDLGEGYKIARHHAGTRTHPQQVDRQAGAAESAAMRELLERFVPDANGALRESVVCLYTNMPDEHFLIAPHPAHSHVLVVSPCSGHGFKFSSVVGEVAARWAVRGELALGTDRFRWRLR
jgi:sarcosine oxidase